MSRSNLNRLKQLLTDHSFGAVHFDPLADGRKVRANAFTSTNNSTEQQTRTYIHI